MAVYILEDDPGVSDALRLLLEALGHLVFTFADAQSFLHAEPPSREDTVIVDLGLPDLPGAEVVRRISGRERPPKVICISGQPMADIDIAMRGITRGLLLRKPLNGEKLLSVL